MPRYKTPHRLQIEEFLADTSDTHDDWLALPYATQSQKSKYYSTAWQLRNHGYPISIIEVDTEAKVMWIRRK